jgi:hypothetical protein
LGLRRVRFTVRRLIIVIALTAVCMWWALHVSERLPDGWNTRKFETAVTEVIAREEAIARKEAIAQEGKANVKIELLAWCTREDDRPLLCDIALAWARIEDQNQVRWALLELGRNPRESAEWHLAVVTHSPRPVKFFNRPPSNSDIYRFVDGMVKHIFHPLYRFRTLNSRVRCRTWYRSVGEMPTRFFP